MFKKTFCLASISSAVWAADMEVDRATNATKEQPNDGYCPYNDCGDRWPNSTPTPFQSVPHFDFMGKLGELGDIVIAKNSRVKFQIPQWLKEYELKGYNVWCEEFEGGVPGGQCHNLEVFIDGDNVMWVEPNVGITGHFIVTLEATNVYGDKDSTTFTVDVIDNDYETCDSKHEDCNCLAQNKIFLDGKRKEKECHYHRTMHLVYDQFFRQWLQAPDGELLKTAWVDKYEQIAYVDQDGVANIWPSPQSKAPYAGVGRVAICHYHTVPHPLYNHHEWKERGFRPHGTLTIIQESAEHDAKLHWEVEGLRAHSWTEGHIHYNGDYHRELLGLWPEAEGVHLNYEQKNHGINSYDDDQRDEDRHVGDITLLKGDKHGRATHTRYDKKISLYGNHNVYGRMADLHFPKSSSYPKGWYNRDDDNGQLNPPNIHKFNDLAYIVKDARHDVQGRHGNDKRGISMCVIGRVEEDINRPPHNRKERKERGIPKWDTVKQDPYEYIKYQESSH